MYEFVMKRCIICNTETSFDNFHKDKSRKDGLNPRCKKCKSNIDAKYRNSNKDNIKEKHKIYYDNNSDKIKEKASTWYSNNKEKHRDRNKQYIKENYTKIYEKKK